MTVFEIEQSEINRMMHGVGVAPDTDPTLLNDAFARATWSGIAEPGDRVAGYLVAALGATDALTALIHRRSAERILGEISATGSASGDDALTPRELQAALARWMPRMRSTATTTSLQQAQRLGARLVVPTDEAWPEGIDDLGLHAPLALWIRGSRDALGTLRRSIALVGARAATGYGEHVAMEAAAGLADRGFAIVSGAAYGIDGMAHRSTLASGGVTLAFLAGGVDRFYPSGHDSLLTRIVETGAVVSELPPGSQPTKWRFLQRNRLIAAASDATVVVEAGWRSGSLNTAGHAAALGRPLGAVPGPVTSPASAGCHRLIRDFDAVCVTSPDEMAELVAPQEAPTSRAGHRPGRDAEATRVIDALSRRSPRTIEDIAARSGMAPSSVQATIGALQLDGTVRENARGWLLCG